VLNTFKLPSGIECRLSNDVVVVAGTQLALEDVAALFRIFFTALPLRPNDIRLCLIDEIRASLVKEEVKTHRRWVVLDALRSVSLRKMLSRPKAAA
jgi:hypothetical protein